VARQPGAIAAALTAAAEYRRQSTDSTVGFDKLNTLPDLLSQPVEGKTRLFRLFTPQPQTRRVFEVLTAPLKPQKHTDKDGAKLPKDYVLNKLWRVLARACNVYPFVPIATLLLGLLYLNATLPRLESTLAIIHVVFTLTAIIVLFLVVMLIVFLVDFGNTVIPNHLGLCTGKTPDGDKSQLAFTDWFEAYADDLAFGDNQHRPATGDSGDPLTFGDLAQHDINLKMFTSCVSRGVPLIVPFKQKGIYFRPRDLQPFFSDRIIKHLTEKARDSTTIDEFNKMHGLTGNEQLYALPEPDDLPVVFGVRFSMSFPILFSAIPLFMKFNLPKATEGSLEVVEENSGDVISLERVYFTDGGICSNFPIDFGSICESRG
jgi:Patatin-like phospholipase